MDIFLRTCAAALVAVILILILKKQGSDWSVVLALLVCCMILIGILPMLSLSTFMHAKYVASFSASSRRLEEIPRKSSSSARLSSR